MPDKRLSPAARAFRTFHAAISVAFLSAIVHVWRCALTGRRDRWLRVAVVSLVGEGTVVAMNHGDCPLGPLQDRLGDPVPLFELVLSPRAARRAVPVLGLVATIGIVLLPVRGRYWRRWTSRASSSFVISERPSTPSSWARS
jgi:hypothetical protein